ncbi:unnamed protein product [Boreogadus saida]
MKTENSKNRYNKRERRSSRKSLDYTKQSLRISIDLGKREEESETWLQVGRIYHLIGEDELATCTSR